MLEERKCLSCGEVYLPPADRCWKDQQPLTTTNTLVGKVLDRRYRIDKVLGVGGMGAVYRSTHLGFRKEFAVKVLHPELMEREDMFVRFQNEAIIVGKIEHENAVTVTDCGVTEEKLAFLVMDIVEGALLRTLIGKSGLEFRRTVELLVQVSAAVHAAHQKNIIHRDLKPDNIIVQQLEGRERVKVLDFGIAKLREVDQEDAQQLPQTKVGMLVGTPQYMSPEQCRGMRGEELKATSDVYSLGVIAYEMLTGRLPFIADNVLAYLNKHTQELPPPLHLYARQAPQSIERVVMRALEKDPAKRQQSALEFAQELRAAVNLASEEALRSVGATHKLAPATEIISDANSTPLPRNSEARRAGTTLLDPLVTKFVKVPKAQRWAWGGVAVVLAVLLGYGLAQMLFGDREPSVPPTNPTTAQTQIRINDEYGVMVLIPAGTFEMGNEDGEPDEAPKYTVSIKAFYLDETEVTNQQYKKFVEAKQWRPPEHWKNNGTYTPDQALLPVTHVTWKDAEAYAQWAGKRLPTEEEWEYAARSGQAQLLYPWGNEWQPGYANANRTPQRLAVGKSFEKDVSRFGIFDLAGNVSEWVQTGYWRYGSRQIPFDRSCPDCKVYRGGNFAEAEIEKLTNTHRWASLPELPNDAELAKNYRGAVFPVVGFRCARDYVAAK